MTKRQDGKKTRLRLLNAACEVFSRKGYSDAKVADICRRAGANVASVNYYFKNKASLYTESWQYASTLFWDSTFSELPDGPPQERLRNYIKILIKHATGGERFGFFVRLYLMELLNPSGLTHERQLELVGLIEEKRRYLQTIIREIIGEEVDDQIVLFCEMSINNQCRALLTIQQEDLEYLFNRPIDADLISRLADHIADFSLAGIKAVGKQKPLP